MHIWVLVAAIAACGPQQEAPAEPGLQPPPQDGARGPAVEVEAARGPVAEAGGADAMPAEEPPPAAVIEPPSPATAGAETCVVEEALDVGAGGEKLRTLDIAMGPRGGLIVWEHDTGHVAVAAIDRAGKTTVPVRVEEMPMGHRVERLFAVGDRFLLFTQSVCDDEPRKSRTVYCIFARAFAADGTGLGPAVEVNDGWPEQLPIQHMATPTELRVVWRKAGSGFDLFRYTIDAGGAVARELVDETPEGEAVEQGYCDSDGERIVARHTDDTGSYLRTRAGDAAIVGLPAGFEAVRCEVEGDEVSLVYALRSFATGARLRPRFVRLGLDGKIRSQPKVLRRGEPVEAPFASMVEGWAGRSREKGDLRFWRTDGAGDDIGETLIVAKAASGQLSSYRDRREAVAWSGDRFLVAAAYGQDRAWKVAVSRIRCAE
jgi:hypothetical protein